MHVREPAAAPGPDFRAAPAESRAGAGASAVAPVRNSMGNEKNPASESGTGVPRRLVALGIVVVTLAGLAWAALVTARGLRAVREVANLQPEWVGETSAPELRIQGTLDRLEARLVQFQLTEDGAARAAFDRDAHEVSARLARESEAAIGDRSAPIDEIGKTQQAWEAYLARMAPLLEKPARAIRRTTAEDVFRQVTEASKPVREACDAWAVARDRRQTPRQLASRRNLGRLAWQWPLSVAVAAGAVAAGLGAGWAWQMRRLRARHEQALAGAQRHEELVSLGTFMAGVAHEIRNPLSAIKVRLFELRRLQSEPSAIGMVEVMDGEVRRLERMLDEVLQYSRPVAPRRERVAVDRLLAGVAELVQATYECRGVAVVAEPGPTLTVDVDAEQIRQVLLNLVRNGAESLGDGGQGTVTLRAMAGVDARGRGSGSGSGSGRAAQPVVLVEVSDNGPGIPEAVQARLFEPFFSTKPAGTGLGLAMAQRMVEAHGGDLRYRTQPGQGTTFTLVLPRSLHDEGTTVVGGG